MKTKLIISIKNDKQNRSELDHEEHKFRTLKPVVALASPTSEADGLETAWSGDLPLLSKSWIIKS